MDEIGVRAMKQKKLKICKIWVAGRGIYMKEGPCAPRSLIVPN